jgi:ABC-type dipeptide/oligopeptide/nickel transport system ATPase component
MGESMSSPLLQVMRLNLHYAPVAGHSVNAVDGVNLCVDTSEVVGLIGESGSGKSTLASAIMRLLPGSASCSGQILFEGCDLLSMPEKALSRIRGSRIALIPQDPAICLNPVLKVATQISEVLRAHLSLRSNDRKQRVRELLAEVGFECPEAIASAYPHELSGGQRQRVVIAQAIACRPALVIADEPTSKLDSALQAQILSLMAAIVRRHSTALLWITHDPATLAGFADRIAVMHRGRIVEEGQTSTMFSRPTHPYTQSLMHVAEEFALASS